MRAHLHVTILNLSLFFHLSRENLQLEMKLEAIQHAQSGDLKNKSDHDAIDLQEKCVVSDRAG